MSEMSNGLLLILGLAVALGGLASAAALLILLIQAVGGRTRDVTPDCED